MLSRRHRAVLLGTALLATGSAAAAIAQATDSVYDPAQMPELHGKVRFYDLTPRGDVDGLILEDGTQVHFPPHLALQVVAAVRPGEDVTIHGLRARSLPLVQAMSVTGVGSGKTVVDNGPPAGAPRPPAPPGPGQDLRAQGSVRMQLYGPRGELNGVLLTDGTMVHLPPPEASRLMAQLKPGDSVVARGQGVEGTLGRSIAATAIGPAEDKLTQVATPPPPPQAPRPARGPAAGRL